MIRYRYIVAFFLMMFVSSAGAFTQTGIDLDSQMERMKKDYREWLSAGSEARLFVEYDPSPIALDISNPRFSWIIDLEGQDRYQTAFQVLVASSMKKLRNDEGDIWDTGLVESGQSVQVVYDGQPFESNSEYFWKVRIRDESGKLHPFSEAASFRTGLLKIDDWTADWIGRGEPDEIVTDIESFVLGTVTDELRSAEREARSPLFRREFELEKKIKRARLFVAGLGFYEIRINGEKVGNHVLTTSRTDYRQRILYDTYDVSSQLENGANSIGIMLGNGWFNGQKKYWGWQMQWYGSPRAMLQLDIEYEDGSKERIKTDEEWKASWSPVIFNCMYDGEHYDARLEQDGWDEPGFDESAWEQVNIVPSPGGKLRSALHEPGLVTKIIESVSVNEPRQDTFVFDLGQNIAGWVQLKVEGPAGTRVKLKFAEKLHPDGRIDPSSSNKAVQEDQYILKGDGVETFEPRFTYHGFQYIQVTGFPGKPGLDAIEGRFVQTAVAPAGNFTCSNDLINRIHFCTVQSQRCNVQMAVPTDDTQRPERQGWGGDALMTAQEAMLNMDMPRVYTKWFLDFHDQQDKFGRVGFITPRPGIKEDLVWSSAFVIMPWYQYVYYGDTSVLEQNYDAILRYMNYLATQGRADVQPKEKGGNPLFRDVVLKPVLPGHLQQVQWGDHLSLAKKYKSWSGLPLSIGTAIYYHDIQIVKKMADVLGKKEHAIELQQLADEVKNAFNERFLNTEEGFYDDRSQSAQAWPLSFGMVPGDLEERVFNTLVDDIVNLNDTHPTTGYVGTKFMIDLLTEKGREDLVWEMANKTDFPSWAWSLRDGKTTITEKWTDGGSQNHVVYGAAIDPWFYNVLAGIRPDKNYPGFKKFIIDPYIPDSNLDWVEATVKTMYGEIYSAWKKTDQGLTVNIRIPANTNATVHLPGESGKEILELGSGTYSFSIDVGE